MEEKAKVEQLISHVKEYAEMRLALITVNFHEKLSTILAKTGLVLLLAFFGIVTTLFLSLGLAWWIGQLMHQMYAGFIIVALIYFVAAIIIYLKREAWVWNPITIAFLKNVTDE